MKAFFERRRFDLLPRAQTRNDVAQPIFILGFAGSGTTLLEQTLSASYRISAGDELPFVHEVVAILQWLLNSSRPYPRALRELWMGDQHNGIDTLRAHYLTRAHQMGVPDGSANVFTSEMPLNEIHMGLIDLVFPKAPVLHLIRRPLDVMVSAMSNVFTHAAFPLPPGGQ